jgi:hypothetical protein
MSDLRRPAPLVCLITPGHVASTPRLVKNANALVAAGYRVHVVAGRHYPPVDSLDAEIFASAGWSHAIVDYQSAPRRLAHNLIRRAARGLVRCAVFATPAIAARAHQAEIPRLVTAARLSQAQLYFGHCLAGLPTAAFAAQARRVPYGFDAEDFHDAETEDATADRAESTARRVLQTRLLPGCALFTAASPLIARHYQAAYGASAQSLLNVFPRTEAPAAPVNPGPITASRPARIYWFSQTVGPGRGLEAVVAILGRMSTPVELQLRGFAAPAYQSELSRLAVAAGMTRAIRFLEPAPPAEMVRLAATADLGLSTEESHPLNRDLCLTNKIFAYLLAGLPQLLSETAAQTALAPELGAAALLADLSQPAKVAARLDAFFGLPAEVARARSAAWELGQQRFNWETEKVRFLEAVRTLIGSP